MSEKSQDLSFVISGKIGLLFDSVSERPSYVKTERVLPLVNAQS